MVRDITHELNIKYNGLYSYSIERYINNKQIIDIICHTHGVFKMSVAQHLNGYGCPYCAGHKRTKEDILNNMKKVHNNFYDYSLSNWIKKSDIIEIICPDHGVFKQIQSVHEKGHRCQRCSNRKILTNDDFIKICTKIDPEIITTITKYSGTGHPVSFICKIHGVIERWPQSIKNNICTKCYNAKKHKELFIEKSIQKYGRKYDYSLVEYIDQSTKVRIIDLEKNLIFEQAPDYHLLNKIPHIYWSENYNTNNFIEKSNIKHDNKYIYDISEYKSSKQKIEIICPTHGNFFQYPINHMRGSGCPKCNRFNIKETQVCDFIKSHTVECDLKTSDRIILNGKEIDIYLPKLKLGFEFNGLYWHSEIYKNRTYHLDKTKSCLDNGISLFHIWEDDWLYKQDIVKSMILNKLGKSDKIYARKCEIKEVTDNKLIRDFLIKNHIQGFVGSKVKLGLFHNEELVSLMTFGGLRKSLGQSSEDGSYELLRFCNKLNTSVIGGASKLFKYFLKNYKPKEIISYSDLSRSTGNMYKKIGFKLSHNSDPNYYYIIDGVRKHRFNFRKDRLVKEGNDPNLTEIEIMHQRGFYRIFDCGMQKWIYEH